MFDKNLNLLQLCAVTKFCCGQKKNSRTKVYDKNSNHS